ncbi:putative bifunctional diguanylate cyclase/phosphodiesterase [Sphingomonas sediminicola]|uniref:putative bifunctional diguanylate cyclase/phosphodiesterase n=1 Tax=Sphingomonas sediminicola TaxID=386874 RepID=UPI001CA6954B|nr:EAL domain-containing protein [Sphingomonas sediminicola]
MRIASSHLITSCATAAAIILFVALGSQVVPAAFDGLQVQAHDNALSVAFILNIAIILFGWRRSKDLKEALDAYDKAERLAERNANTDPATGLANRRELMSALELSLAAKSSGVLLLLDLDHFKRVNDLHGHLAGDKLLKIVADALVDEAPADSCCARIGGDEFAILLDGASAKEAEKVAQGILSRLSKPVDLGTVRVFVSASIGLSQVRKLQKEEDVLRESDFALYAAKRAGRNCFAWFDPELERELTDRVQLEEDIRSGIENGEFVPFFQPLIDLTSRELVGFEALARWRSPTRGFLEAETFIEAAEKTGLIGPLTISVVEQALKEARDWPPHLKIAINVSPVQFRDPQLAQHIMKVVTEAGFPAHRLEVEITEASLLEDREQVLATIGSLKNVGISISLDDFGTGYASLSQVNTLPIDRIKIDKSFISTIVKSEQTAAIVNTITSLGHTLNVPITAEGIESEQVRNELGKYGCAEGQGYLFGRPLSADTVRTFLDMKERNDGRESPSESEEEARPKIRRSW